MLGVFSKVHYGKFGAVEPRLEITRVRAFLLILKSMSPSGSSGRVRVDDG